MTTAPLVLADTAESLLRLLGRLHPAVVHFPIALVLTAFAVELFRVVSPWPRTTVRRQPSPTALTCLGLGAIGGAAAAWFGWLSAAFEHPGSSQAELVDLHRWIGVVGAGVALVVFVLGLFGRGATAGAATTAYRLGLFLASAVIGIAAHFGASLVHGEAYITSAVADLVAALRGESPPPDEHDGPGTGPARDDDADPGAAPTAGDGAAISLAARTQAIFAAHCVECHGPKKQKGRLRLDDVAALAERDVIVPGDPDESELVLRIELPADDPDLMPPEGEPLSAGDVETIRAWIAAVGAGTPTTGGAAPAPAGTTNVGAASAGATAPADASPEAAAVDGAMTALLERGAIVQRVSQAGPEVEVDFSLLRADATDADLALLRGLEPVLVSLDLGDTGITPDAAGALAPFVALERLQLQRTAVTDASMPALAALPALHTLNIYGTLVGDAGLMQLRAARALRKIYAWDAAVTPEGVAAFRAVRPDVEVELGDAPEAPTPAEEPAP